jgi:nucleoside-diphosphate-sugar epimerase
MKILVIGGTGTVGLPSVSALVASGHHVVATARGDKAPLIAAAGAEPINIDIFDVDTLRRAIRGCGAVIRLTTKLPRSIMGMRSQRVWDETNRLRSLGAQRITEAALHEDVGIYVHESFYAVYADAGDAVVTEDFPTNDGGTETMRAALDGEACALRFARDGRCGIVLRFGGFYGTRVPTAIEIAQLVKRRMLPQIGDGRFYLPSVEISDAAQAVAHALKATSGAYNISDDEPLRYSDYLRSCAEALGAPAPTKLPGFLGSIMVGYPWRWMSRSVRMSNARFKAATGWQPRVACIRDGWRIVASSLDGEIRESVRSG